MKKVIALTLTSGLLLTGNVFADEAVKVAPVVTTSTVQELPTNTTEILLQKYDTIIRNNKIVQDNDYNSKTYFTKKIKTEDLVIPAEIKEQAKKIYFLVEEGNNVFYAKWLALEADMMSIDTVEKEYNYKVVNFTEGKTEYTFNSADLLKDFSKDEYKNVTITLVAEFANGEKLNLANPAYVSIGNKENILETLKNEKDPDQSYFGYYDAGSLETYLEKLGDKMARNDYKAILTKSQTKLKSLISKNEASKKETLASIKKESDFADKVETYALYSETGNLLSNVANATKQQLQKIRSYELIDSVFTK